MENQNKKPAGVNVVKGIIAIVVLIGLTWFFFGGGLEKQADKNMAEIENKVAVDAEKQYNIAKSGGDKYEIAAHSAMVSAAYLQAKDSVNYKKWKEIEKVDKKAAGLQ